MGVYRGYNDKWILENVTRYTSWRNMFNAYYEIFHFGNYRNFRNHLYNDLGLTRKFTQEQNEWLKQNYAFMGRKLCTEEFNKRFLCGRSVNTIAQQACKLGLRVDDDIVLAQHRKNAVQHPIGHEVVRTNTAGISAVWVKTDTGWVRKAHLNYGEIPSGYKVVHLDNDFRNNEKENLAAIPIWMSAKMTGNKFWSENPDVTKAGILWCELNELLKQEVKKNATN